MGILDLNHINLTINVTYNVGVIQKKGNNFVDSKVASNLIWLLHRGRKNVPTTFIEGINL